MVVFENRIAEYNKASLKNRTRKKTIRPSGKTHIPLLSLQMPVKIEIHSINS